MIRYKATGDIYAIADVQHISDKFSKRQFVLELDKDTKWPQLVQFECTGNRIEQLDGLSVGDEVEIEFNLRGRESHKNGKTSFWNSLDVWKVEATGTKAVAPAVAPPVIDDGEIPF